MLIEDYGVVLVAAAGNKISYQTNTDFFHATFNYSTNNYEPTYTGTQIGYPASYDGVISVSSINHYYNANDSNSYVTTSPLGFPIHGRIEDSFAQDVSFANPNNPTALKFNGFPRKKIRPDGTVQIISPNGITVTHTINEYVDILAPTYKVMNYRLFSEEGIIDYYTYGGGTSTSAPFVSATAALMLGVNNCLNPYEVDDILKLTAKDVEHMQLNSNFFGELGFGKLETGNAVEFVDQMQSISGVAEIKDHIFYRDTFELYNIANTLSVQNVEFIDDVIIDFKAKNSVELEEGTLLEPNTNGSICLQSDPNLIIETNCQNYSSKISNYKNKTNSKVDLIDDLLVYPNPTNNKLNVETLDSLKEVSISDFTGKVVFYNKDVRNKKLSIDISMFSSGLYIVKVVLDNGEIVSKKIIKN